LGACFDRSEHRPEDGSVALGVGGDTLAIHHMGHHDRSGWFLKLGGLMNLEVTLITLAPGESQLLQLADGRTAMVMAVEARAEPAPASPEPPASPTKEPTREAAPAPGIQIRTPTLPSPGTILLVEPDQLPGGDLEGVVFADPEFNYKASPTTEEQRNFPVLHINYQPDAGEATMPGIRIRSNRLAGAVAEGHEADLVMNLDYDFEP